MKFLKTKNISKFSISDRTFLTNTYGRIITNSTNSLQLPVGATAQRPATSSTFEGQIRYNSETDQLEAYQASQWRNIQFREPSQITYQTIGPGNDVEILFGPLDPAPPATVENGLPWSGRNLIVLVENVFQIFQTNYTILQNPCNILAVNVAFDATARTITSSNVSITNFVTAGFHADQTISITGSGANNGVFAIDSVTSTVITLKPSGTMNDEPEGNTVTIVGFSSLTSTPYAFGYYVKFNSPVPSAGLSGPISVTIIHGFDK